MAPRSIRALLDVMHQSWTALVIDRIIPAVAPRIYRPAASSVSRVTDPNSNGGMRQAAVALLVLSAVISDMLLIVNWATQYFQA
jgi:hypothetical protein